MLSWKEKPITFREKGWSSAGLPEGGAALTSACCLLALGWCLGFQEQAVILRRSPYCVASYCLQGSRWKTDRHCPHPPILELTAKPVYMGCDTCNPHQQKWILCLWFSHFQCICGEKGMVVMNGETRQSQLRVGHSLAFCNDIVISRSSLL